MKNLCRFFAIRFIDILHSIIPVAPNFAFSASRIQTIKARFLINPAFVAQEKSNMYNVHSTEIFRYNNNKPVSGPLFGTTMIKKSKRKNGF